MSDCRRHILASHVCPMHILGGDRLELVMDYTSSKTRPLTISSRGIVWGQFSDLQEASAAFYDILLGRKDPLAATRPEETVEKTVVKKLRLITRKSTSDTQIAHPTTDKVAGVIQA
jgi:hypothetical protein